MKKIALLSATNTKQVAYEFEELGHGALSYALITTLRNKRSELTKNTVYDIKIDELFKTTQRLFEQTNVRGSPLILYHQPHIFGLPENSYKDIVIASIQSTITERSIKTGTVYLETDPAGATIFIDGQKLDKITPATIELPSGKRIIVLQPPNYSYRHILPIDVAPGSKIEKYVKLKGDLRITTVLKEDQNAIAPKVNVYLDDVFLGKTDILEKDIIAGTHELRVEAQNVIKKRLIEIRPDSPLLVRYKIVYKEPEPGRDSRHILTPTRVCCGPPLRGNTDMIIVAGLSATHPRWLKSFGKLYGVFPDTIHLITSE